MQSKNIAISVIIVTYKSDKELLQCLNSINKSTIDVNYEVLVVDNENRKNFRNDINKKFPHVKYIASKYNRGFGSACNMAARYAKGEYIFFLNPDTEVSKNTLSVLYTYVTSNTNVGAVAPLLTDTNGNVYQQGSRNLGIKEGVVALSFLNKLFPNNRISKKYFLSTWNKKSIISVDVVPGTAFMMTRSLFKKLNGFDEKFFLYFEEFDLCKRIKELGYDLFIIPTTKVKHLWGASTKKEALESNTNFIKSRFYYFSKHYNFFSALLVELFARINKYMFILFFIVCLSLFLRTYKIDSYMDFIGDYGWFYLSAKDFLVNGDFPFVGIPSSRPWLHQGAFWTYLLSFGFALFGFHPVSGAYISAILGVITCILIYIAGSYMFSKRTGILAALLYTTSPLIVLSDRIPYHTSPIPFFVILFIIFIYKWLQGNVFIFPFIFITLAVLYNFEIATVVLWFPLVLLFICGFYTKRNWFIGIVSKKNIVTSILGVGAVLLPMILYDVSNGFVQTGKFLLWIPYRIISFFSPFSEHIFSFSKVSSMVSYFFTAITRSVAIISPLLSMFLVSISFFYFFVNRKILAFGLLLCFFTVSVLLIFFNQTPSDAYLPVLFPFLILVIAKTFDYALRIYYLRFFTSILLIFLITSNVYMLLQTNFFFNTKDIKKMTMTEKIAVAKSIIKLSEGKQYVLIGRGQGSQFDSFTMSYKYLTWWLGHPPSEKNTDIKIIIQEQQNGIVLRKE